MNRHYYDRMQKELDQLKEADRPEPIRSDGAGALDLGPRDLRRDEENPDMLVPPATDHGLLPNLRFSFSDTHIPVRNGCELLCLPESVVDFAHHHIHRHMLVRVGIDAAAQAVNGFHQQLRKTGAGSVTVKGHRMLHRKAVPYIVQRHADGVKLIGPGNPAPELPEASVQVPCLRFLGFVQADVNSFHLGEDSARVFVKCVLCLAVLVQPLGNVRALPDKYRRM